MYDCGMSDKVFFVGLSGFKDAMNVSKKEEFSLLGYNAT
jgi:hypothetical protein